MKNGVTLFEVRGDLKTPNARRPLPLHPGLERLGIVRLVAVRRKAGKALVFDGAKDGNGKWGDDRHSACTELRWTGAR